MPNREIFCNIPWFEININNDGSYDLCGCQNDKIQNTPLGQIHNIRSVPIEKYWNEDRMKESRLRKLGDVPDSMCRMCQAKDAVGYQSSRVKENIKSVIFPEAFERSYEQSPNFHLFEHSRLNAGETINFPVSLHVNLGHTCNFSCRMCNPIASTRLQTEYKQLGWIKSDHAFNHWTEDLRGWSNFTNFLQKYGQGIKVIHIIGGEVEFIPKFHELVDYFISRGWASTINLSFTTNGSVDYSKYYHKFGQYRRCEIGISIESIDPVGDYIRQGGNVADILRNITHMHDLQTSNMQFVIRTVPSLLSLPTYANLIKWSWNQGIPVDNSLLISPTWLQAVLLSADLKQQIIADLSDLLADLPASESRYGQQKDPSKLSSSIRNECEAMIKLAQQPQPANAEKNLTECARRLSQWDALKKVNLKDYHIPLFDFLTNHGYAP
jgi:MoaA/NifB/PqqE/SkfB family radical SAM enzyme